MTSERVHDVLVVGEHGGALDQHQKLAGESLRIRRAGPPYADAVPYARRLVEFFPDRVLWGTDWPHPNIAGDMPNDGDLVDLLAEAVEDEAVRRRVLVDNPTRLYWAR